MGDFNHNLHRPTRSNRALLWYRWIQQHWHDPIHVNSDYRDIPTFRNISTIDFLLVTNDLKHCVSQPKTQYVPNCDHSAISMTITLGEQRTGPGIWRCNPLLVNDKSFRLELTSFCDAAARHIPMLEPPAQWDHFKVMLKGFIQNFTHKLHAKMNRKQDYLQRRRRLLLRQQHIDHAADALKHVESQLDQIAESTASTLALRSGSRWREYGERSNSYFYRTIKSRRQKQAIHELQSSDEAMEEILNRIPPSTCFNEDVNNALTSSWTEEEILSCVSKAPRNSSPGVDGIPYEILQLLLQHLFCRDLFAKVLNLALRESKFPATWQQSVVVLLPKKGERSQLQNWRPISLICADAKIFTRLLATRINEVLPHLIDVHQTGFMPERFIADNGATTRLIMNIAERFKLPGIALLLDQEKAYDRVHPQYLQACLERFGFPSSLITSILSLFFGTSLCINVNGFLTASIQQASGLRQGDPLSPLFFNLVIEHFLRSIRSSSLIWGFTFPRPLHLGSSNLARTSLPTHSKCPNILTVLSQKLSDMLISYLNEDSPY
ncbi:hypothetical protein G6F24_011820 [Rhizopus arrhizus]|nr:hypothetical protein G6F24_011820 [Rhizopus arrhizus]